MEENQIQQETDAFEAKKSAPVFTDNAVNETLKSSNKISEQKEGQSDYPDPSNELLLGKFKSVEELSKAYNELQKHQGENSEELGNLRKTLAQLNNYKKFAENLSNFQTAISAVIERDKELYNSPEYLQNPVFKEIYSEALMTFGDNLDTDRLVGLLDKYVENRILSYNKEKSANSETQKVLDSMTYSKNPKNTLIPPKKTLDEMTDEEFKVSLRKLI